MTVSHHYSCNCLASIRRQATTWTHSSPTHICVIRSHWVNATTSIWWRHQMETFSALLAICAGNSPGTAQRPVMRSFDVFFDLRLNKWLCKQSRGWWFETLLCPLWRHCNGDVLYKIVNRGYQGVNIDGLMQDCSNSSALAMELLQFCNKLSICVCQYVNFSGAGPACSRDLRIS